MKTCEWCGQTKPFSEFVRNMTTKDRRDYACCSCRFEARKALGWRCTPGATYRPRRSPYDNMRAVLNQVARALEVGPAEVMGVVNAAREKYLL